MYRVAIVCEGPSDRAIIEAVLDYHLDDYEPLAIQPPISKVGEQLSAGWKGVRAWCEQEARSNRRLDAVADNSDLLIIQLDADVATEDEMGLARLCPPPQDMANEVRLLIRGWLGLDTLPSQVLLCVSAMASETWALVALFPHDPSVVSCQEAVHADGPCIECREDVKTLLRRLGRNY